jgi:hypothetical protein
VIVVAETNFVLELAFSRDKFANCQELLALAERNEIQLVLPAYCLVEPYETLIRRRKSRKRLHETISVEVQEIARSAHFEERARQLAELTGLLIDVGEVEQSQLDETVSQLLRSASIVDLSTEVLRQSMDYREHLGLTPQDSVVLASVLSALNETGNRSSCFITRNKKDFALPEITEALGKQSCKLMFDFELALQYVRHELGRGADPEAPT